MPPPASVRGQLAEFSTMNTWDAELNAITLIHDLLWADVKENTEDIKIMIAQLQEVARIEDCHSDKGYARQGNASNNMKFS